MKEKNEKYKIWWDEEHQIIRNQSEGDFEDVDAKDQIIAIHKLADSIPGKVAVLNDLTNAGTASSGARKTYAETMKSDKISKHAFLGMRTMTRVIVSFIMKASGVKNTKFFDNKEDAIRWLKEE